MHSVTSSFSLKTVFKPFVQFQLFCMYCKLSVNKVTKLSATGEEVLNSSNATAVQPVYSNQVYTILAHQKSLIIGIKRAGTPIYKLNAKNEKE